MRNRKIRSTFGFTILATLLGSQMLVAARQSSPKLIRDDVYRIIARQVNAQTDSPVTDVIGALDEVIEVGEITISDKDGKATVIVKERTPSNIPSLNKSIRLVLAPAGNNWKWEMFENDRKLYPVEKLFPYVKDEVGRRRQVTVVRWTAFLEVMTRQADAAFKLLETAKAIIKSDPAPLAAVTAARAALAKAKQSNDQDALRAAFKAVAQALEPVAALSDQFQDLKANDAYLRLQDELIGVQKAVPTTRNEYLHAVAEYNDTLQRLPFALVAYGLGFTKIEPPIEAE